MGSSDCPAFLGPLVLEVIMEHCFPSAVCCVSQWFPYSLCTCLLIVLLSNSLQMTEFVSFDFMEKSHWLDKAGANFSSYFT